MADNGDDGDCMTVMFRRDRMKIRVGDNIGDVLSDIEGLTGVACDEQVLIVRGKKVDVRDWEVKPSSVGLHSGVVALVMRGRQSSPRNGGARLKGVGAVGHQGQGQGKLEMDSGKGEGMAGIAGVMRPLREVEREVNAVHLALRGVSDAVSRETLGFLDASMTNEALGRDEVVARKLEERLMKLLEVVDATQGPAAAQEERKGEGGERARVQWRAERKTVVSKVQTTLREIDALLDRIRQLRDDVYGEMERRRGRS